MLRAVARFVKGRAVVVSRWPAKMPHLFTRILKMKEPFLPLPLGFLTSGVHAGLKKNKKLDMGFIVSRHPALWAGMVTKNAVKSAPARRTEELLRQGKPLRAIVVNTKYANDLTGRQGYKDAADTALWAARILKVPAS